MKNTNQLCSKVAEKNGVLSSDVVIYRWQLMEHRTIELVSSAVMGAVSSVHQTM